MKTFNSLHSMENNVSKDIYNFMKIVCQSHEDVMEVDADTSSNFSTYLGGEAYIVETSEDLRKIGTLIENTLPSEFQDPDLHGWKSLYETASEYDMVDLTDTKEHVIVFLAGNNAGGPSYFIPYDIAKNVHTVNESFFMFNRRYL